ncbi:MAG: ISL3 family transposase, partial [Nitrososphaerales archaeon]
MWVKEGKDHSVLEAFYDELGEERLAKLEVVTLDMGGAYETATNAKASHVTQCVDPFHLVKLANDAIDKTRRQAWNLERRSNPAGKRPRGRPRKDAAPATRCPARWIKHTRWALLKDPDALKPSQLAALEELRRRRSVLYRCWQLKEGIRDLYRLRKASDAAYH